jgi:hypothetical protein
VSRSASCLFAASLFLALCLAGTVRAAEEADRSTLEDYVIWTNRALKSLPDGVQLLEPLAQRLVELTSERRREADADLEPLETDPELLPAARVHALDISLTSGIDGSRYRSSRARNRGPCRRGRRP